MLPKFHKKLGYDVEIIASTLSFDEHGNGCNINPGIYDNEYGIKVTRLPYKKGISEKAGKFLRLYKGFEEALSLANPDIIFVHGCQFCDISVIVSYARTHNVTIYVDNHGRGCEGRDERGVERMIARYADSEYATEKGACLIRIPERLES